jgi:hypothetical protein
MFLILFTGILVSSSFAQTQKRTLRDSIFFTGVVMDQKELTPLPNTHFRINAQRAGTANQYGRFSFWVNTGDTVRYSYVGYQDVKLIISDSLEQEKYLFGVFMAKDTVALREVLILPRFGDFREAFVNAKVNTPDYVRAKNNVNTATYEALTTAPKTMDAKANTDLILKNYQTQNEYRAMIPPDMIVGVSLSRTLPEVRRLKRKRKLVIKEDLITDQEINILKSMYEHEIKSKK